MGEEKRSENRWKEKNFFSFVKEKIVYRKTRGCFLTMRKRSLDACTSSILSRENDERTNEIVRNGETNLELIGRLARGQREATRLREKEVNERDALHVPASMGTRSWGRKEEYEVVLRHEDPRPLPSR